MTAARSVYRVMTVCTGNICRSPIAEAVLRDRFEAAGLGDCVMVDSAGVVGDEAGNPSIRGRRASCAPPGTPYPPTARGRCGAARSASAT